MIIYRFVAGGAAFALVLGYCSAQTQVDLRTQSKSIDFSGAASTKPFQAGTVLPGACSPSQVFFKTNATAGANLYGCTSANIWTAETSGATGPALSGNNSWSGNNDFTNAASVSLPAPWVAATVSNTYAAGAKQIFQPSATKAGIRLVGANAPSNPVGGDLNITLLGAFEWFDGAAWNVAAPLTSPNFTTPSLGAATATSVTIPGQGATSGTNYACFDTTGKLVKSVTPCSGT
jgi:hypothetical protein